MQGATEKLNPRGIHVFFHPILKKQWNNRGDVLDYLRSEPRGEQGDASGLMVTLCGACVCGIMQEMDGDMIIFNYLSNQS